MKTLAMIGCGLISRAHGIAAARSVRDLRFSCCSSRSVQSAKDFADEFGCDSVYETHHALLAAEQVDGVVIAAPPAVHLGIIEDCLAAGVKHILCEKPLTLTADEAVAVEAAALKAQAIVLEAFQYRHHPQTLRLLDLLSSGSLGKVDQLHCAVNMIDASETGGDRLPDDWRRDADSGGGVLHDFLCYPIDLANQLISAPAKRVIARTFTSPNYGTAYRIFGMVEYINGAVAMVAASRLADFSEPLYVGCTSASVTVDPCLHPIGNSEIVIHRSEGLIGIREERVPVEVPEPESERLIDMAVFTWQLEHFLDLLDGIAPPRVTLQESIIGARIRDALIGSGKSGDWQDV